MVLDVHCQAEDTVFIRVVECRNNAVIVNRNLRL